MQMQHESTLYIVHCNNITEKYHICITEDFRTECKFSLDTLNCYMYMVVK